MNDPDLGDAIDQGFLSDHVVLVFKIDYDCGDSHLFQFGQVRQLPPHCPTSPADGLYQSLDRLHFLLGKLDRTDGVGFLSLPVYVRIVHLEAAFQRDGNVRLAGDAKPYLLSVERVESWRQRVYVHRHNVADRVQAFVDSVLYCS